MATTKLSIMAVPGKAVVLRHKTPETEVSAAAAEVSGGGADQGEVLGAVIQGGQARTGAADMGQITGLPS